MKKMINKTVSFLRGVSTLDTTVKKSRIVLLLLISIIALGGAVRGGHSTLDVVDPSFNPQIQTSSSYYKSVDQIIPLPDGKMLVSGEFNTYNHQPADRLVRLNADGTLDMTFNGNLPSGTVNQMVVQADGKILIINEFWNSDSEVFIYRLIRLNTDGSVDATFSFPPTAQPGFESILIDANSRIILNGVFPENNVYRSIIRLNPDGSPDPTFQFPPNSTFASALATQNNKIIIISDGMLQRLNENGTLDSSFITRNYSIGYGSAIVQPDGKILLFGESDLRRLNEDGSDDPGFQITTFPFPPYARQEMALSNDGKINVAINISNNVVDYQIRRLLANGTADSSFTPYTAARFNTLAVQVDGDVLIGDASWWVFNDFVRLFPNGSPDPTFNTGGTGFLTLNPGTVETINVQPDGKILIGGLFEFVNDVSRWGIARLNADSTLDTSFQINTTGTGNYFSWIYNFSDIRTLSDGKIVATGRFDYVVNGATKSNLVRLNPDGSIDPTLILSVPIHPYGPKQLVTFNDGKILVGTPRFSLEDPAVPVKLTATGERDSSFNTNLYPQDDVVLIRGVAVQPDGKIIIGGVHRTYDPDITKSFLTRLNADGSLDTTFQTREQLNKWVRGFILLPNGKIVIAEDGNVLRLTPDGSVDPTFNAGTGANGNVNTMLLLNTGRIFVGGSFTNFNGQPRTNLVQLNADGSVFTPTYSLNDEVLCLAVDANGRVFVGGNFTTIIAGSSSARRSYVGALIDASPRNTSKIRFDFDGDGKTDISIVRPSVGEWWYSRSSDAVVCAGQFGTSTDIPTPGDFTGDGKADIAFWRPSDGFWYILRSEDGSFFSFPFGTNGDIPMPADFDADGKTDAAIFRPSTGTWFIPQSGGGGTLIGQFGANGDLPVAADYDGDGKADVAIIRRNAGNMEWWMQRTTAGFFVAIFGVSEDKAVPGDFTGDGKTDIAVWRPSNGNWVVLRSEDLSYFSFPFGSNGDIPAPGDYDGDGKTDATVFRPSVSTWFVNRSGGSGTLIAGFGVPTDQPVPSVFVR